MPLERRRIVALLRAALGAAGAIASLAVRAQDVVPSSGSAENPIKVFVTGSNISVIEGESGLPLQIIMREQIERANLQTAAELVSAIPASFANYTENQSFAGSTSPGLAGVGLRGLTINRTLVLLNGRRIANYAFAGNAVDLNAIPLAAVERVEVLLDGASAVYGADAIGGVVNFVLRQDFSGVETFARYASPEHTGGWSDRFSVTAGYGNLQAQRFNAYATLDYQRFGALAGRDRDFSRSYYIPGAFNQTSGQSFPANVRVGNVLRNPLGDPANGYVNPSCAPPASFVVPSSPLQCSFDPGYFLNDLNGSERISSTASFKYRLTPEHQFFLDGLFSRNRFTFVASPASFTNRMFLLPPASAFYPHAFAATFGIDGQPLDVRWRSVELGGRTDEPTLEQWNAVAGLRGTLAGWNYDSALSWGQNRIDDRYTGGYVLAPRILPLLNSGAVNPFGYNAPDIVGLMSSAVVQQTVRTGTSTASAFDFRASRDVYAMPAGSLAVAFGAEARRWTLNQQPIDALARGDILGGPTVLPVHASRKSWAVFGETNVPLTRRFQADVAVRFDHYSDVGSTTNPKLSLRWQPDRTLLLRASVGTGFRAPGLEGLYTSALVTTITPAHDDGARCPVTQSARDCTAFFQGRFGGNPSLRNETSSQWGIGGVWEPDSRFTLGLDYFDVIVHDTVFGFDPQQIFTLCPDGVNGVTCRFLIRGPVDPAYPSLPGPIDLVDVTTFNIGKIRVTGIDVDVNYRLPRTRWGQFRFALQGSYNIKYAQQTPAGSYLDLADRELGGFGLIPRWHHYLTVYWDHGPWAITVTENFVTGARDEAPNPGEKNLRRIGNYDVWSVSASYSGFKDWVLSFGIRNIADRNPPFTNQTGTGNAGAPAGYDPTYTDPRGRVFWGGVKYSFR